MAKKLTLREALNQIKTKTPTDEALALAKIAIAGRAVLHLSGNVLDVDQTLDAIQFCDDTGESSGGEECVTLDAFLTPPTVARPACPITGRALRGDKTTTDPVVDWNGVSTELRETAGYAAVQGQIGRDLESAVKAVYELKLPALPPPWPTRRKNWIAIRDAQNPTPDQAAIKVHVLNQLRFRAAGTPAPTPTPTPAPTPAPRTVQEPHADADLALNKGVPSAVQDPPAPTPAPVGKARVPHMVILYADNSDRDLALAKKLIAYLSVALDKGTITIWSPNHIKPGAKPGEDFQAHVQRADIFVYVVSMDLLSGTILGARDRVKNLLESFPSPGKTHVPIIARSCMWQSSDLGGLVVLPRSEVPIASSNVDTEHVLTQVTNELLNVAKAVASKF